MLSECVFYRHEIWNPDTLKCVATLHGHTGSVLAVAADSSYIYTGSQDKLVKVRSMNPEFDRVDIYLENNDLLSSTHRTGMGHGNVLSDALAEARC